MSDTVNRRWDYSRVALLIVVTTAIVGYMLIRLNGMIASNDVSVHTTVAAAIQQSGSLTTNPTYSNGFGYPALVALLSSFTGLSIAQLQEVILPFLLVIPVVAGFVTFRAILDSRRGLFATLLLLIHPFFLFSGFRTTHEKFTYTFILLAICSLYISFAARSSATRIRFIVTVYLTILGIIFLNVFFASSFIVAVATAFGVTFPLSLYYRQSLSLQRLGYTLGVSFALLMTLILFLYPPARKFIVSLGSISQQTLFLILGNAPSAVSGGATPYRSVFVGWSSFGLYLFLISFYLVAYPVAGLYWLYRAREFLSERSIDRDRIPALFVHILFLVFGIQLTVAIVADQTGVVGSNTQLRIFPVLGFLAIVLTTAAVFRVLDDGSAAAASTSLSLNGVHRSFRSTVVPFLLIVLVVTFSVAGVVKATSDPSVSRQWTVTTDDERETVGWTEQNLQNEYLWVGYEARLRYSHLIAHPSIPLQNRYDPAAVDLVVQYVIMSDTIKKRALVAGVPLPPTDDASRVYTNGDAQVYRFDRYRRLGDYNDAFRRSQRT